MRVIFLTHNYPRHPGDLPGGFLHPLAKALQGLGVDIRVVAPSDAGRGGAEPVEGIPVRRMRYAPAAWETLAYTGGMMAALRDPRGMLALGGMLRALRRGARAEARATALPVVVHAHWWFPAALAAPPELPQVVTLHGTDGRLLERWALARALARRVLRRAAVVTTVSEALAGQVTRSTGIALGDDQIQGLPLDASRLLPGTGGGGVLAVARLTPQKRLHLLIEAIRLLKDHGRILPLTLVGGGEDQLRLAALVEALGLAGQVRMTGPLDPGRVAALLATADVFVLPAEAEGYGLAAAEALIVGVPVVVCSDGGGLLEIARARPGTRVSPPTAHGLAAAIGEVLDDPTARASAREAGARLRARLDPVAGARQALQWYQRALARRP